MKVKTSSGSLYFVTFIDDCSRKLWVYALKSTDQVLSVFKQFQASVERETEKKLKCIRSDNNDEYCGSFDEYCKQHGIRHQKTPPKTPQLNGLAEKMNKTLVERVRCLLSETKLHGSFLDVSYDHLHVFSCKAFVHVPKDKRSKLDVKTRQCVFISYGHDDFGHRFYDLVKKKLVRSRDVIFMEDQSIEDIDKAEKSKSSSVGGLVDLDPTPTLVSMTLDVVEHDNNDEHVQDVQVENNGGDNTVVDTPAHRVVNEPTVPLKRSSYEDVMETEDKAKWIASMNDEMKSLYDNHTFELVKLPKGKKVLNNRWIYRLKNEGSASTLKYKAKLVVKGYEQKRALTLRKSSRLL
ncbi:hypothetical protein L6164_013639 [Bauhinia variegata]|uniref:Uncharacterized protein n=1 Tax=Bauhinia variegata TaxID=167791 RepID=A0ACB9NFK4_BAUVA|nr:hypothetical protein L6164_013639 [Bauhinia variegata]